jgi:pheromone shutdown protein TraB
MTNDVSAIVAELSGRDDPRLDREFWRFVPATTGQSAAILVGVVHDHPASMHRVETLIREFEPDAVGLELPATSLPHFVRTANAKEAGDGGEMAAAIAAAGNADVEPIDTLGRRFFDRFARRARTVGASFGTVRRALRNVGRIVRHAVAVRFERQDATAVYGDGGPTVTRTDAPSVQADDERTQVARSRSLLGAIERPPADVLLDETRERTMAANVDELRESGTVVAVVGMDHLDDVADELAADS